MSPAEVARVSREVAAEPARSRKVSLPAAVFRAAGPPDVPVVIPYPAGCRGAGSGSGPVPSGGPRAARAH
ncbi:hypothetical protein ACFVTP_26225 [Streptomyces celluloflavus]|uniref:hypothetical protein n=1 Tax=Streptomyces celluloflavus TaxID=58344 RepID=UPI0036DBD58D